jgi:ferredoxin
MESKIKRYMEKMGYGSLADFRGLGLKYIVPQGKARWLKVYPVVDEKRCNGCGLCTKMGHCEAYTLQNGKGVPDLDKCVGCVYCQAVCRRKAITMKESGEYAFES